MNGHRTGIPEVGAPSDAAGGNAPGMVDSSGPFALTDLRCGACARPHVLDLGTGWAEHAPDAYDCPRWESVMPLWQLLDRAGFDLNPSGAERPTRNGRPIPWLTPVTAAGPHWRLIHRGRLGQAQRHGLCQVCGLSVTDDEAMLVVDTDGWCLTSAALHPACAKLSSVTCPVVARTGIVRAANSGSLRRDGEIAPEIGMTQRWQLLSHPR
ncbi:hypothetical protein OG225_07150 [Nocardia sp. NBC_01377]|uniref:hypothetical protein n=1 Tax=Nocardia sp. NBC_01377 TaxID=2903595 RepID=UPI00324A03FC